MNRLFLSVVIATLIPFYMREECDRHRVSVWVDGSGITADWLCIFEAW